MLNGAMCIYIYIHTHTHIYVDTQIMYKLYNVYILCMNYCVYEQLKMTSESCRI